MYWSYIYVWLSSKFIVKMKIICSKMSVFPSYSSQDTEYIIL